MGTPRDLAREYTMSIIQGLPKEFKATLEGWSLVEVMITNQVLGAMHVAASRGESWIQSGYEGKERD